MKHYGVVHGTITDYAFEARKMLGQLDMQMGTTNQKFGSWQRKLADGTIIRAIIIKNGAVPIYKVIVSPALEPTIVAVPILQDFIYSVDGDTVYNVVTATIAAIGSVAMDVDGVDIVGGEEMLPAELAPDPLASKYINNAHLVGTLNWGDSGTFWRGIEAASYVTLSTSVDSAMLVYIADEVGVPKFQLIYSQDNGVYTQKCYVDTGDVLTRDGWPTSRNSELLITGFSVDGYILAPSGLEVAALWRDDTGDFDKIMCQLWDYDPVLNTFSEGSEYTVYDYAADGQNTESLSYSGSGTVTFDTFHTYEQSTSYTSTIKMAATHLYTPAMYDEYGVLRAVLLQWQGQYAVSFSSDFVYEEDSPIVSYCTGSGTVVNTFGGVVTYINIKTGAKDIAVRSKQYTTTLTISTSESGSTRTITGPIYVEPNISHVDSRNGVICIREDVWTVVGTGAVNPSYGTGDSGQLTDYGPFFAEDYDHLVDACPAFREGGYGIFFDYALHGDTPVTKQRFYYVYDSTGLVYESSDTAVSDTYDNCPSYNQNISPFGLPHVMQKFSGTVCFYGSGVSIGDMSNTHVYTQPDTSSMLDVNDWIDDRRSNDGADGTVALEFDWSIVSPTYEYRWLTPTEHDYTAINAGFSQNDRLITYINNGVEDV